MKKRVFAAMMGLLVAFNMFPSLAEDVETTEVMPKETTELVEQTEVEKETSVCKEETSVGLEVLEETEQPEKEEIPQILMLKIDEILYQPKTIRSMDDKIKVKPVLLNDKFYNITYEWQRDLTDEDQLPFETVCADEEFVSDVTEEILTAKWQLLVHYKLKDEYRKYVENGFDGDLTEEIVFAIELPETEENESLTEADETPAEDENAEETAADEETEKMEDKLVEQTVEDFIVNEDEEETPIEEKPAEEELAEEELIEQTLEDVTAEEEIIEKETAEEETVEEETVEEETVEEETVEEETAEEVFIEEDIVGEDIVEEETAEEVTVETADETVTEAPDVKEEDLPTEPPVVTLSWDARDRMNPGELVTLTATVSNAEMYWITYQWQCDLGDGFKDVEGANGAQYSFAATAELLNAKWQVIVDYKLKIQAAVTDELLIVQEEETEQNAKSE